MTRDQVLSQLPAELRDPARHVLEWLLPDDDPVDDLSAYEVLQFVWCTLPVKWADAAHLAEASEATAAILDAVGRPRVAALIRAPATAEIQHLSATGAGATDQTRLTGSGCAFDESLTPGRHVCSRRPYPRGGPMRMRTTWARAGVCLASAALLVAATAQPAGAAGIATGQTLGVGDIRCTDHVRSDNGVRLTGFFTNGTGEWTVLRSSAVGGPETVVLRAAAGSRSGAQTPVDRTVAATTAGTFVYRACVVANTIMKYSVFSITHYQMLLTSSSPTAVTDLGPETATLSASATACGDRTAVTPGTTVRLVGTGSGRTQWFISVTGNTNNYEGNWAVLLTTTDGGIDETVALDPEITEVTACAGGSVTTGRVAVSYELSIVD